MWPVNSEVNCNNQTSKLNKKRIAKHKHGGIVLCKAYFVYVQYNTCTKYTNVLIKLLLTTM